MPRHRAAERAALGSLLITAALAASKTAVWAVTSSLVVLSQALDSGLDLIAIGLVYLGVRIAGKPADDTHHYGHAKAENLVTFTQTLVLGVLVAAVAASAIAQLSADPERVATPWYAVALLVLSAGVDAFRVRWLLDTARAHGSDALRAGALNFATDLGTAVVAVVSLFAVRAGALWADAAGALVVAMAVGVAAVRLGKQSVDVLMDRAPAARLESIRQAAAAAPGVTETRRVRVRGDGKQLFADVTVGAGRTASLERAHDIAEGVEREIARVAPGVDVVVHVEPTAETSSLVERVQAAASRLDGVHEIHNVLVHAFNEGGKRKLHVTLHAKVTGAISLEAAHRLSDRIEGSVAQELAADVRVDTHIEPLEPTSFGRDVTSERQDLVAAVRSAALEEPDVLDCHEVIITASHGDVSVVAHVRGRGDLPLARMHDASQRIENTIHSAVPEIGAVLIHFEPG